MPEALISVGPGHPPLAHESDAESVLFASVSAISSHSCSTRIFLFAGKQEDGDLVFSFVSLLLTVSVTAVISPSSEFFLDENVSVSSESFSVFSFFIIYYNTLHLNISWLFQRIFKKFWRETETLARVSFRKHPNKTRATFPTGFSLTDLEFETSCEFCRETFIFYFFIIILNSRLIINIVY